MNKLQQWILEFVCSIVGHNWELFYHDWEGNPHKYWGCVRCEIHESEYLDE